MLIQGLLIFIVLFILMCISFWYLPLYIIGFLPDYRARPLNESDINKIKRNGIVHITEEKNIKPIMSSCRIKSSSRRKSYSCHFKQSSFFFISELLNAEGIVFNISLSKKKRYSIINIQNLTDKQILNSRTRNHDNSIMHTGDFCFDIQNKIMITSLKNDSESRSIKNYINKKNLKYSSVSLTILLLLVIIWQIPFSIFYYFFFINI